MPSGRKVERQWQVCLVTLGDRWVWIDFIGCTRMAIGEISIVACCQVVMLNSRVDSAVVTAHQERHWSTMWWLRLSRIYDGEGKVLWVQDVTVSHIFHVPIDQDVVLFRNLQSRPLTNLVVTRCIARIVNLMWVYETEPLSKQKLPFPADEFWPKFVFH